MWWKWYVAGIVTGWVLTFFRVQLREVLERWLTALWDKILRKKV